MPRKDFADNLRTVPLEEMAKIPVVSYFRVSTIGQGDKDKSGLDRQEEATHNLWFSRYGRNTSSFRTSLMKESAGRRKVALTGF